MRFLYHTQRHTAVGRTPLDEWSTIRLTDSALCPSRGERDDLPHRITACGEGRKIWERTRQRIAWILRTVWARIPTEWTLRPQFHIWPPIRHMEVLWILAHMVWYRIRESRTPSEQDYLDFLRRARWKAYQDTRRVTKVGNYLSLLWTNLPVPQEGRLWGEWGMTRYFLTTARSELYGAC